MRAAILRASGSFAITHLGNSENSYFAVNGTSEVAKCIYLNISTVLLGAYTMNGLTQCGIPECTWLEPHSCGGLDLSQQKELMLGR